MLDRHVALYAQMIDPDAAGPASTEATRIFRSLNEINVIAVRPLVLALQDKPESLEGMREVLRLVVRRVVTGGLGTGNVERRFGEAASQIQRDGAWHDAMNSLRDLNPKRDEFVNQLATRPLTRGTLHFIRRSIVQGNETPEWSGYLHTIRPRQTASWPGFTDDDFLIWGATLGNSFIGTEPIRPASAVTWDAVKRDLLPLAVRGEWAERLKGIKRWDVAAVRDVGREVASAAAEVWYG
jgi:hypothetical protein